MIAYINNNWKTRVVTLSCKPSLQDAKGLLEHILQELSKFDLTPEMFADGNKMLFTTHDGAAVIQ